MNKKYQYAFRFLLLLCAGLSFLDAQGFEIDINSNQGVIYQNTPGYFNGGLAFSAHYQKGGEHLIYSLGLEARMVQWGTQVGIVSGMNLPFGNIFELKADLQNGLALFHIKPLYVYSIGLSCRCILLKTAKIDIGAYWGGQFTHCPAYRYYGSIDHVFELPIGLFFRF